MTRWARVGSTQKHHKTPGDSTPWEELSKEARKNSAPKEDNINRIQKGRIEKKKHNMNMGGSKKFTQPGFQTLKKNEVEDFVKSDKGKMFKSKKSTNADEAKEFQNEDLVKLNKSKMFKNKKLSNVDEGNEFQNEDLVKSVKGKIIKKKKSPNADEEKEFQNDVDQNPFAGLEFIEDDQETENSSKKVKSESSIGEITNSTGKVLTKSQRKKARRKMKKLEEKKAGNAPNKSENEDEEKGQESDVASPDKVLTKKNSSKKRKLRQEEVATENVVEDDPSGSMDEDEQEENKKQKKSTDKPVKAQNGNLLSFINKDYKSGDAAEEKTMTKKQWKKARRMKKLEELKAQQSSQGTSFEKPTDEKSTPSLDKDFFNKKQLLLEKLEKRKPRDGTFLLPSKVERKIFNIKRKLMDKGLSPKILADIVRKERKREEEKFKKTFSTRPCFNCREIGHLLSDCPLRLGISYQETGLCFKCGSTEHTSYKCPKKVEGYPLAKCFVCKEQGHISKDCPKNEHGVYIKGGKCSRCGNVNHLRKDCPADKKGRKDEDVVLTVGTINEGTSVDEEIQEPVSRIPKKKFNKPKVVKF